MRLALTLGRRGLGQVWPNPAVGCVIVKDGRILGRGWTAVGGRPHAETQALAQAGPAAKGATVYVTLEPCAHTGQTPPCAQALINADVARVVVACDDPDPRVNGGGIAMLRASGMAVTTGVEESTARADHAGFLSRITRNRPFVTLKLATSLDGRIATQTGESQWITGPDARRAVHALRATHDAVMVGAGTVRADNPQLTVRGMGQRRQPVRVVLSTGADLPMDASLFQTADAVPVWMCHGADADVSRYLSQGIDSVPCALTAGQVDMVAALKALADSGITRLFCEGGSAVAGSLLRSGLVDRLELFQAGKLIGGDGLAALGSLGVSALSDAHAFVRVADRAVGADLWTSWDRAT